MIVFAYSIENIKELVCRHGSKGENVYYFKYYLDFLKAKELGLNAFLAEDLWDKKARDEAQEEIYRFMETWFLNNKEQDTTEVNNFSFAKVFNGTVLIMLCSLAKYAGVFIKLHDLAKKTNEEVIICFNNENSLSYKIAAYLNCFPGYSFALVQSKANDHTFGEDRFAYYYVVFRKDKIIKKLYLFLCWILRFAQKIMYARNITGKIMFFMDNTNSWLKSYANRISCIISGVRPLFSSWFIQDRPRLSKKTCVNTYKSFELLLELLKKGSAKGLKIFGCDISPVFRNYMLYSLALYKQDILNYAYRADDAIEFYRPKGIIVNYGLVETVKIFTSLAAIRNIPAIYLLDGYGPRLFYQFEKNDLLSLSRSYYCEFSDIGKQELERKGVKSENIFVVTAPLIAQVLEKNALMISPKRQKDPIYDFIVFTSSPNNYSVHWQWNSRQQYLCDILDVCIELGSKRIGVKLKSYTLEWPYYKELIKKYEDKLEIDILTGPSNDHYHKTTKTIGGLSTAMAEAAVLKNKYYIYDPLSSGYYESGSLWQEELPIARDKEQLKQNIQQGRHFCHRSDDEACFNLPLQSDPAEIKEKTINELAEIFSKIRNKSYEYIGGGENIK